MRLHESPNPRCQRTAAGRRGCNRRASWPPSLSLGRRPHRAMRAVLLIPVLLLPLAACTHRQYVQPAASTIGNKVTSEAQAIAIVREDIQRRGGDPDRVEYSASEIDVRAT